MGLDAAQIEDIASLREAFKGPVIAILGDADARHVSAAEMALGSPGDVGVIDWRIPDPDDLQRDLAALPGDIGALLVRLDANWLKTAGPCPRSLCPDVVIFADGVDPAIGFDMIERLGGARTVILPQDDPRHGPCVEAMSGIKGLSLFTHGRARTASVRLLDCQLYTTCSALSVQIGRTIHDICIGAPGMARVQATLAALVALKALGGDIEQACLRFAGGDTQSAPQSKSHSQSGQVHDAPALAR